LILLKGIVKYLRAAEESGNSKDTDYALKRLVRGLASSREAARLGFASCLVEVLKLEQVGIDVVYQLIEAETRVIIFKFIQNNISDFIYLFDLINHRFPDL